MIKPEYGYTSHLNIVLQPFGPLLQSESNTCKIFDEGAPRVSLFHKVCCRSATLAAVFAAKWKNWPAAALSGALRLSVDVLGGGVIGACSAT